VGAPIIQTNEVTPGTVNPGQQATWNTVAIDPDARTASFSRTVEDTTGQEVTFDNTITISDQLTYGPPTTTDPGITLTVDPVDETIVHVQVAS
jgi:hypothetical protein